MSSTMCRYHPDKPAEFECADCHKRFCSKCVKEVSGKYYCEVCKSRLKVEVKQETERLSVREIRKRRRLAGFFLFRTLRRRSAWFGKGSKDEHEEMLRGVEKEVAIHETRMKGGSLLRDLKDSEAGVRLRAADTLAHVGDATAVEPLAQALKDESRHVRSSAARALGTIGDGRAVGPLIEALKDESLPVRSEAAWALGRIGDETAVEPLTQALEDDSSIVRKAAQEALNAIRQGL